MGKIGEGAKAGVIAGILLAVIQSITVVALLYAFKSEIVSNIRSALNPGTVFNAGSEYNLIVEFVVVLEIFGAIIIGLILGLVVGAVSDRLPGKSYIAKGLAFGVVMWLILTVAGGISNLKYGPSFYLY